MTDGRWPLGVWIGEADVIVKWAQQRHLDVRLEIRDDGAVTGRVGDAVLLRGVARPNRGALGRLLRTGTDFVVRADLSGYVLRAPASRRARVMIPFNAVGRELRGSVFTDGPNVGAPERQQIVAANMVLRHE